jgi:hypothetical protein
MTPEVGTLGRCHPAALMTASVKWRKCPTSMTASHRGADRAGLEASATTDTQAVQTESGMDGDDLSLR